MSETLVLVVLWPIAAGIGVALAGERYGHRTWPMATAALVIQLALAVRLLHLVMRDRELSHLVGSVASPYGIELVVDGLSVAFLLLASVLSLGLMAYTRRGGPRSPRFLGLLLLLLAGLTGIIVAGDIFTLYVFLELSGLVAYALVAYAPGGEAALAALRYLLIGTVGATLYLLGVGYVYIATGTLNMAALGPALEAAGYGSPLVIVGFALMLIGLSVKVALVPVHTWLPGAHSKAPVPVSVLLSGVVTAVAGYVIVRLSITVFGPRFLDAVPVLPEALLVAAAASVVYGGYAAIRETAIKRVLAYSTVAQVGLGMLGLGLLDGVALTGTVVHLVGHGVMKGGLFLAAGSLAVGFGAVSVEDYAGLGRRAPVVAGSFAIGSLGMIGIPPTVGLVSKWYLALGAIRAGAWPVAGLVLVSTLLSLAAFGPILARLFFEPPPTTDRTGEVSLGMRAVALTAAIGTLLLGFSGPVIGDLLTSALLGVG